MTAISALSLAASSGPASGYRPALIVPELKQGPVVDGRLDADEWDAAARITGFVRVADGMPAEAATEVFVARDSTRLLIAARCTEPHMSEVRKGITLLPASLELAAAEQELVAVVGRETMLRDALAGLSDRERERLTVLMDRVKDRLLEMASDDADDAGVTAAVEELERRAANGP